jgi:hypothetical protein
LSKRTILYLMLGSIVLFILGIVLSVIAVGGATTDATGAVTGASTSASIFALVALGSYIIGGILALIGWIGALIKTATIGAWGWFVVVLILSGLGALIYGIAGPETRAAPAAY